MIRGKVQADLSGPIGITKQIAKAADRGAVDFLGMIMMLSVYLGLFNLLPLPALDGGRALFLGIESVTRKRVEPAHRGGRAHGGLRAAARRAAGRQLQGHLREGVTDVARRAPAAAGSAHARGLVGRARWSGRRIWPIRELRREYARDIAPRTRAALAKILAEVYGRRHAGARAGARSRRRHGRGAARRCAPISATGLELVAVDRRRRAGGGRSPIWRAELPRVEGRFDLIVAAHLLNELYLDRADRRTDRSRGPARARLGR